jgi:hypothetical protein
MNETNCKMTNKRVIQINNIRPLLDPEKKMLNEQTISAKLYITFLKNVAGLSSKWKIPINPKKTGNNAKLLSILISFITEPEATAVSANAFLSEKILNEMPNKYTEITSVKRRIRLIKLFAKKLNSLFFIIISFIRKKKKNKVIVFIISLKTDK